ncbi:MAG: D-alanyl-D-alanine carboxypeptidase [Oscillospiraceae bacterium]|nr:D-alanyl-D-alanine carboxypeptidase [Oscillospiraceae bacterium]
MKNFQTYKFNIPRLAASALALAAFLFAAAAPSRAENGTADIAPPEVFSEADGAELDESIFSGDEEVFAGAAPEITSPSAILIERETATVIFEKDADSPREPASVTKVMTMLLVVEAIESGAVSPDDSVAVSARAASMGGTQIYLREGEEMSVRDMLKGIAVNSANDAAVALAEHISGSEDVFVARMNEKAAQLGMAGTYFTNCSGLLKSPEHRTTARDIAAMSRALLGHGMIREYTRIWTDSLRGGETSLANTNKLVRFYDGATGLKTGYTNAAGYCVSASAERGGVEYIAVTLGDRTSNDRFESARALLSYAFATYTLIPAGPDGALAPIRVSLGKTRYIQPEAAGPDKLLIERADAGNITKTAELPERLAAPVRAGDVLGAVVIKAGGRVLAETEIIAGQDSEKLLWGDIFLKLLKMLFTAET